MKGILDYASMKRRRQEWEAAAEILDTRLLNWDYFNLEGLLLKGDICMDWGEEDPSRFEEARISFAKALERYGQKDEILERMMIYLIRSEKALGTDNRTDIYGLRDHFMSSEKTTVSTSALAELSGYMLDRDGIAGVYPILLRAITADPAVAEAYYQLARYYKASGSKEEVNALVEAERLFSQRRALDRRALTAYFDTLDRASVFHLENGASLDAERYARSAIDVYENGVRTRVLKPSPMFGASYAHLADVYYFHKGIAGFEEAIGLYDKAARELYETPETHYRRGFLHFQLKRFDKALVHFHSAGLDGARSDNLAYATAVTLYKRNDFFAAEAYFSRLLDELREKLRNEQLLQPQKRIYQYRLVEMLMWCTNNLAVTLLASSERMGDSASRSEAMALFVESTEYHDALTRDPNTMLRLGRETDNQNLAYLNIAGIMHPDLRQNLIAYVAIEKTMDIPIE